MGGLSRPEAPARRRHPRRSAAQRACPDRPAGHAASDAEIGPGYDFAALLGADGRIATGDPAHVPVGIYAEQALKKLGQWGTLATRLAPTEDVRAALLLVERGEAPAGIVYATDAGSPARS